MLPNRWIPQDLRTPSIKLEHVMGCQIRQMGRGMPPPPEEVMDIEGIVEASRWTMRSN